MRTWAVVCSAAAILTGCAYVKPNPTMPTGDAVEASAQKVAFEHVRKRDIYFVINADYHGPWDAEVQDFLSHLPDAHPVKSWPKITWAEICQPDIRVDRGKNIVLVNGYLSTTRTTPAASDYAPIFTASIDHSSGTQCKIPLNHVPVTPLLKLEGQDVYEYLQAGVTNTTDLPVADAVEIVTNLAAYSGVAGVSAAQPIIRNASKKTQTVINGALKLDSVEGASFPIDAREGSKARHVMPLAFYEKPSADPKLAGAVVFTIEPRGTSLKGIDVDGDGLPDYRNKWLDQASSDAKFWGNVATYRLAAVQAQEPKDLNKVCLDVTGAFASYAKYDQAFIVTDILTMNQRFASSDTTYTGIACYQQYQTDDLKRRLTVAPHP